MNLALKPEQVLQDRITESAIRTKLVRHMLSNWNLRNSVVANEARYGLTDKRADFAIVDRFSHAFEIKSDFDTTTRLSGQLSEYSATFDYVTVVTTPRYASKVRSIANPRVGLWVFDGLKMTQQRIAKQNQRLSKQHLAASCGRASLISAMPGIGRALNLRELQDAAVKKLLLAELRELFLQEFRSKFTETTKSFLQEVDTEIAFEDLLMLRRVTRISA